MTPITIGCARSSRRLLVLTNCANSGPKGVMAKLGRISIARLAPLRAVIAVVFLLMSAVQPALFAGANATGFHSDASFVSAEAPDGHADTHHHAHGDASSSADVVADQSHDKTHRHGSSNPSDKSCEVHCAPAHAVPVTCPEIEHAVDRCFAPVVAETLPLGEYTALIRPPRPLS